MTEMQDGWPSTERVLIAIERGKGEKWVLYALTAHLDDGMTFTHERIGNRTLVKVCEEIRVGGWDGATFAQDYYGFGWEQCENSLFGALGQGVFERYVQKHILEREKADWGHVYCMSAYPSDSDEAVQMFRSDVEGRRKDRELWAIRYRPIETVHLPEPVDA